MRNPNLWAVVLLIIGTSDRLCGVEADRLECTFDAERGLVTAAYAGVPVVKDGEIIVKGARLQRRRIDDTTKELAYDETHMKAPEGKRVVDVAAQTVTWTYDWGSIATKYTTVKDRLTVAVTIHNATDQHICGFWLDLMRLALPLKDPANVEIGDLQRALDRTIVQASTVGGNVVAMVYETIDVPLAVWIDKPDKEKPDAGLPLRMTGGLPLPEPAEHNVHPGGMPSVGPGKTLTLRFSLRFAPAGTAVADMIGDVEARMRELHGTGPNWKDRRPIGMLIASSVGHRTATNPRGWFHDKTIDVTTEAGREKFRTSAMTYADHSIDALQAIDAQGAILWDIEGSENPHPVTYIGDPRLVGTFAPEMDTIADELFKKFADAGLRTGVTLRPSRVYRNEKKGGAWAHNPGNAWPEATDLEKDYEQDKQEGVPRWRYYPIARRLSDKIAYAKKRWGCTIFYIDTNLIYQWIGEGDDKKIIEFPLASAIYRSVLKEHPDILLIPERWKGSFGPQDATYAHAAAYMELDLGGTGTPERIRRMFPNAFSIVNVADGSFQAKREQLLASVRKGDILMVRGWFKDKQNLLAKDVYDEVAGRDMPPELAPEK
jgi:hypothetical protein